MPHGYLFRSQTFQRRHGNFPGYESRDRLFAAVGAAFNYPVPEIEIFRVADIPLSKKPLDVELKIQLGGQIEIFRPTHAVYWVLRRLITEIDPDYTVGIWTVQGARSCAVTAEEADEKYDMLK